MNTLIAVVVAFLANGQMNYAAADCSDEADCKAQIADIAHQRLEQNEKEDVKVLGFSFQIVKFERPALPTAPQPKGTY